jgi:hypothetical protein
VPVNEELDALVPLGGLEEVGEGGSLGGVALGLALVVVSAGVGRSAARDRPLVRPVAVDVAANAAAARVGLAVLAPEAVVGLSVDETW